MADPPVASQTQADADVKAASAKRNIGPGVPCSFVHINDASGKHYATVTHHGTQTQREIRDGIIAERYWDERYLSQFNFNLEDPVKDDIRPEERITVQYAKGALQKTVNATARTRRSTISHESLRHNFVKSEFLSGNKIAQLLLTRCEQMNICFEAFQYMAIFACEYGSLGCGKAEHELMNLQPDEVGLGEKTCILTGNCRPIWLFYRLVHEALGLHMRDFVFIEKAGKVYAYYMEQGRMMGQITPRSGGDYFQTVRSGSCIVLSSGRYLNVCAEADFTSSKSLGVEVLIPNCQLSYETVCCHGDVGGILSQNMHVCTKCPSMVHKLVKRTKVNSVLNTAVFQ